MKSEYLAQNLIKAIFMYNVSYASVKKRKGSCLRV